MKRKPTNINLRELQRVLKLKFKPNIDLITIQSGKVLIIHSDKSFSSYRITPRQHEMIRAKKKNK